MSSRYFANPFHSFGKADVNEAFYKRKILKCIEKIFDNLEPTRRNGKKGLYTGSAGVAYSLYRLVKSNLFPDRNREYMRMAQAYLDVAEDEENMENRNPVGLMSGNSGIYLVAALLSAKIDDKPACRSYVEQYQSLSGDCEDIEFLEDGCDEMFVGRAGYIFGALLLQRELSVQVLTKPDLHAVCNAVIESGVSSRQQVDVPKELPLYYEYHSKAYLGAGHGYAAILQSLLSVPSFLNENPKSLQLIKQTVDFLLRLCDENIATNLNDALSGNEKFLVHWCHGAAGIIYLFARAYLVFNRDPKYLNACRKLAETVWNKGLLKKGPGICHGVAGSGYVFLLMYRLTGEENYLYRAERFASFLFTEEFSAARTPDRPFSLFEGWAGTVCFLVDLLQPDQAEYPFMNVFM